MHLKTKLSLGLIFLFIIILLFGILGIASINKLSNDASQILQNNHESVVYCSNMLKVLDSVSIKIDKEKQFENSLAKQEGNITEIGEREATQELRHEFDQWKLNFKDPTYYPNIRTSIIKILDINEMAIQRRYSFAQRTAENAKFWLTVIFTGFTLIALSFIYNLPGIIFNPLKKLSEGIREVANKNYSKRIYLERQDEFGDLAKSFNDMATHLDEYENSNLSKIKFEKKRIETIINQMHDAIIGLDENRNILFINPVAEKLLAINEASIIGKFVPDIALNNDLMRTLLKEENEITELKIYSDGKLNYFNKDILNVTNDDQSIGQVIILRNITKFHEISVAKTNFIATISHELKTPIFSMKLSAQLLSDGRVGVINDDQKELLASIRDDSDRLTKIIGELLNMTQLESGNIQLKIQHILPEHILNQAIQTVQSQANQRNISLSLKMDKVLPGIQADSEKSAWVLINFLTNAIKFSPENNEIEISVYRKENSVAFTVLDHGQGIDEKYTSKIFERYFKVPSSNEHSGSGLGLAISKEFIEAQNGNIWVESEIGKGSKFGFSLKIS
jgi:PAS domain S-box-containing protein